MRILKANTAVRLVVGPLCDKTTKLAKTGMTVTNMAMNMWHEHYDGSAPTKTIDGISFTASGGDNDMVELAGGYYDIEITAAQTNITSGRCAFLIYDDDVILPYFEEWLILPANVFDSIMGTDKLDVRADELTAIKAKTDLITTGTAITIASPISGSTITAMRGDTLSVSIEGLGSLEDCAKLYMTVKMYESDSDVDSIFQIEKTAGLLYINRAPGGVAGNGSISIDDAISGDISVTLEAVEMAKILPGTYIYDIQIVRSTGVTVSTLTTGTFIVPDDVTKAIS